MIVHRYFVTCPRGIAPLLRAELEALGGRGVVEEPGGCRVRGPLEFGYRMCLWSRLASRVLLLLEDGVAADADALYDFVRGLPWEAHMRPTGTLMVEFSGVGAGIEHSQYGAQRVKDAVVDRFRELDGRRPDVERHRPDLRIHVHVRGRGVSVGVDLSGESLHRRGYRVAQGAAPLKENLAAALLAFGDWTRLAGEGAAFLDPMAGSGTLVVEAAMIACDVAPGSLRAEFGLERWLGHDAALWTTLRDEARERAAAGRSRERPALLGFDEDPAMVAMARENAERAGVAACCTFERGELRRLRAPTATTGLVASNPPYGERLGTKLDARETLAQLGAALRAHYTGWTAVLITPDDGLLHAVGMPVADRIEVANGPTPALFVRMPVAAAAEVDHPLHNRMRKNAKRLKKWATRQGVTCYRVYDADLPEYNAAVDLYEDRAHVQEYEAPSTIEPELALRRLTEVTRAVSEVFGIPSDRVHVKTRRRQRGKAQYERLSEEGSFFVAREGGHRFWVNLTDYLDTGLFLDHRDTRAMIERAAAGTRFLNLFCYTGSVSVYAAKGGAKTTTSVDLSNTYLQWAERNFVLNGIPVGPAHRLVRSDCLRFLEQERDRYDLIFLDPPTFSNSKAMTTSFDVRRDHRPLVEAAMARLAPGGLLVFSTNARRFKLDPQIEARYATEDWTRKTMPQDFAGQPPHRCWQIRQPGRSGA